MRDSNNTTAQVIQISSSHYQMGYQHGRQVKPLRPSIVKTIEARFAHLEQDDPDEAFETLVRETSHALHSVDPATIDVIRGLAGGLNLKFDQLLHYNLVAFLSDALTTRRHRTHHQATEGCTTRAATRPATADGQPILAKNRDYRLEHLPLQVVVQTG